MDSFRHRGAALRSHGIGLSGFSLEGNVIVLAKYNINTDHAARLALPWPRIWLAAVARPTVATYQELARQPRVGSWDAWIWLVGSSFLSGALVSLGPVLVRARPASDLGLPLAVFTVLALLTWAIFMVCIQQISRLFKGAGEYPTLVYSFAAFHAPLMLLASGLSLVPHSRPGLVLLYIYWLMLYSIAVQAAHQLSWMKAVGAVLLSLMLLSGALLGLGLLMVV
jgi:Yip1 domain